MFSYTHQRDQFIVQAHTRGLRLDVARKLLRYATTLQRLEVASLNGDWPKRGVTEDEPVAGCPLCQTVWASRSFRPTHVGEPIGPSGRRRKQQVCPVCYTEQQVRDLLAGTGLRPVFGGDARGGDVLRLVPSETTAAEVERGKVMGIKVPPSVR